MKPFLSILLLLLLFSCRKNNNPEESKHCEIWDYYETCEPKQAGVVCVEDSDSTFPARASLCGNDLDSVSAGAVRVVYEDTLVVRYRHYLRKVN